MPSLADLMRALVGMGQPQQPATGQPIPDPLDFTNVYNTPIPPEKQAAFNKWVAEQTQKTGKNPLNDRYDYDVSGLYLSGQGSNARGHSTDQFKKPNHPSFSDQSIYHGVDGLEGGTWTNQSGQTYFKPGRTNLQLHGLDGVKEGLADQGDGDVLVLAPPPMPQGVVK